MATIKAPNFEAARMTAAGLKGSLISKLSMIRRLGGKKRKTTTPHKKT